MHYRLVDDELPRLIAARLGTSPDVVESLADRPAGFAERVLARLTAAVPEANAPASPDAQAFASAVRHEVELLVRAAADGGDAIIVGRLAGAILGPRRDVLRAFVTAPLEWRIARVAQSLHCSPHDARVEIGRVDSARRRYARDGYGIAWGDAAHYELVLDTAKFGIDGSAAVLAAAVAAASAA